MSWLSRRWFRALLGAVVSLTLSMAVIVAIKATDGALSGQYKLVGLFTRAGEGLHVGSEIDYRGVQIGRVDEISLYRGKAMITMNINPKVEVARDSAASIEPLNLFGTEGIIITMPHGRHGSILSPGDRIRHTTVSNQLSQLFQAADPLLGKIDSTQLSSVISDLYSATNGEGHQIASGIEATNKLATLFSTTLPGQIQTLQAFANFATTLAPTGISINSIASSANELLPLFNQEASAYHRLLTTISSMSGDLATLVYDYRPDIVTLLAQGANVSRVLLARQSNIAQVIDGIELFITKIIEGISISSLPNGAHYAFFKIFVEFSDLQNILCGILTSVTSPGSSLSSLDQVLVQIGNPLGCNLLVPSAKVSSPSTSLGTTPNGSAPPELSGLTQSLSNLAGNVYGIVGSPDVPSKEPIQSILNNLLGGL